MQHLMKLIAVGVVVTGTLLTCDTRESAAQVAVTTYYAPQPVVGYMRVRRGLFGLRRGYVPVVTYAPGRAVTSYYAPATPITTYYAPAAPVTTSYYAPATPVTTYYAPAEPVTTYYAPAEPVTTYYTPAEPVTTYRIVTGP